MSIEMYKNAKARAEEIDERFTQLRLRIYDENGKTNKDVLGEDGHLRKDYDDYRNMLLHALEAAKKEMRDALVKCDAWVLYEHAKSLTPEGLYK